MVLLCIGKRSGEADVFLIVTLTNYEDSTEAYRPGDTLLAAGLNLQFLQQSSLMMCVGKAFIKM